MTRMNTGFLRNPAPDSGFNAILGALAPHSAPPEGSLGSTTPSVQNRVKQTFINPVASYPFIVRPWKDRLEQCFHPGDLMFIYTGENANMSSKSVIMANLPILNHIMAGGITDIPPDRRVVDNWSYVGVMRNSATASDRNPRQVAGSRGGNREPAQQIINVDVRGASRMFNYWQYARPASHLFLVWQRFEGGEMQKHLTVAQNYSRKRKVNELHDLETSGQAEPRAAYWQLIPWDARDKAIDTPWTNEQLPVMGLYQRAICVGFVFQHIGKGEESNQHLALMKATQMAHERFKLPMIPAFVRV